MKCVLTGISLLLIVLTTANLIPGRAQEATRKLAAGSASQGTAETTEKLLRTFASGKGGGSPSGKLIFDSAGNLYGTTLAGGGFNTECPNGWCGAAFELTPTSSGRWKETVLHDFTVGKGGAVPLAGLIFDFAGNLYGTTYYGGRGNCSRRCGVVFELTPSAGGKWTESVLYAFTGGSDGGNPSYGLIFDTAGNLYGTTESGGSGGVGVVFELTPTSDGKWEEKVLHSFSGGRDGRYPSTGLSLDSAGNLYGGTSFGGNLAHCQGFGCGVVFKLVPTSSGKWKETVLHSFTGGKDGAGPSSSLIFDLAGNPYGATGGGGMQGGCQGAGCGLVFKLTPTSKGRWKETVLYTFTGGKDGAGPDADLTFDAAGNLYGTTYGGGIANCGYACGVAFKLTPASNGKWKESVLHSFTGGNDGGTPASGLILDPKGNLYGSAEYGGADGWGVVFELTP
jgi:uncharacterized repeat protein (TIGR03803 family)